MPEQKPRAGGRIPPKSKKHFSKRKAEEERRGRDENTAEIMAEVLSKSQWLQGDREKDLFSGKKRPFGRYEELLKRAYEDNKNVFKLRKKQ